MKEVNSLEKKPLQKLYILGFLQRLDSDNASLYKLVIYISCRMAHFIDLGGGLVALRGTENISEII
jgi:hypothetical protein